MGNNTTKITDDDYLNADPIIPNQTHVYISIMNDE
uniref:Uncharacterized protein n=1 Tax=viral metagenome TaxID=1070528 RepID=A0A6C0J766_9ZZZZ